MRKTFVVLTMILLVFIVPGKCLSMEWSIDEIDWFTMSGSNLSMAFDKSTNTPHISYLFNDAANGVRYATLNDGVWSIELVTNSQGHGTVPIALNEIDNPVIFYGSNLDKTWYLATRDGAWSSEIVQSGASVVGWRASLAINPNGDVHAAYFNNRSYYHTHAWKSATGWNINHDAPGNASFSAMKFDSIGVLHKAYNGYEQGNIYESKIYYAKLIDGSWVTTPVYLQSTTILSAMDLDSNIYPHILFSDRADESHTILKYIYYDGNQWRLDRSPEIDVGANWGIGSLAVDSQDRVHIAFTIRETVSNVSGNKLMYGFLDNSGWHMEEIQPELISQNPNPIVSIATDNQDRPVIAFYDTTNNALKYAHVPNQPPVLDPIGNKTGQEGQLLEFQITATDPNPNDVLTFNADNLPDGATFDSVTATFSWTPGYDQSGVYENIEFIVSDDNSDPGVDNKLITITVGNVNRPPEFAPLDAKIVNENETLQFAVTALDPDDDDIELSTGELPAGASFDPVSGTFSWTPDNTQAGYYVVGFYALDNGVPPLEGELEVAISVGDVPTPIEAVNQLIKDVRGMDIKKCQKIKYIVKLKLTKRFINRGRVWLACFSLNHFIDMVAYDMNHDRITQEDGQKLIVGANYILTQL